MRLTWTPKKFQTGPRTKANEAARRRNWQAILRRANFRCEGCGAIDHLELAHLCGRPGSGMCLGPWANSVELGVALCASDPMTGKIGCHPKIDRHLDEQLRANLDYQGCRRLHERADSIFPNKPRSPLYLDDIPSEIRKFVRRLEAAGILPNDLG